MYIRGGVTGSLIALVRAMLGERLSLLSIPSTSVSGAASRRWSCLGCPCRILHRTRISGRSATRAEETLRGRFRRGKLSSCQGGWSGALLAVPLWSVHLFLCVIKECACGAVLLEWVGVV